MSVLVTSIDEMTAFAVAIGRVLDGGEVFELVGDVGSGKTTFTKGLAQGLDIGDDVHSPSFTVCRVYDGRDGLRLVHYDFYRLSDPGIMAYDIAESVRDARTIVVVEWAMTIAHVLPRRRTTLHIAYGQHVDDRCITITTAHERIREIYATWH